MSKGIVVVMMAVGLCVAVTQAALNATGDVDPADPTTWTSDTIVYVGKTADGSMTVDGGTDLISGTSYLGWAPGVTGEVTVDGAGTTWGNRALRIGFQGDGVANITNGARVDSAASYIGYLSGSTGVVNVDGAGSTWSTYFGLGMTSNGTLNITNGGLVDVVGNTEVETSGEIHFDNGTLNVGSFFASPSQLTGVGTINTHGLISDVDLVFDATHGLTQTLVFDSEPGQNITIYLQQDVQGVLGVGRDGEGSLTIRDGLAVVSYYGEIGHGVGSSGTASVDGVGSRWDSARIIRVGHDGDGTLSITDGGVINSGEATIGYSDGSTGVVTVSGAGSMWISDDDMEVGFYGAGTLNIVDGGLVSVGDETFVSTMRGHDNEIHFANGTLDTGTLRAAPSQLTGTGTIYAHGLIMDMDLVFDSTHGPEQTLVLNDEPGQDITIHLSQNDQGDLGVGHETSGSLTIRDGVAVTSKSGYVGFSNEATGTVLVEGAGSSWTTGGLYAGYQGNATLDITDGGVVSSQYGYIARARTAKVTVDGAGSRWTNSDWLTIGSAGGGTLKLANGGVFDAGGDVSVNTKSFVDVHVSNNDMLTVGGNWTNDGAVTLKAGIGLVSGNYTPFSVAGAWGGDGDYDAFGGTWAWDGTEGTYVLAVWDAITGNEGQMAAVDLTINQRLLVLDGDGAQAVGASFDATSISSSASSTINFLAEATDGATRSALLPLLGDGELILSSWNLASDLATGERVYLSFAVGAGLPAKDLRVWRHDAVAGWTQYDATDLTYTDAWAMYTVDYLGNYAITGVPEPATLCIMGCGAIGLLRRRRPKGKPLENCASHSAEMRGRNFLRLALWGH